MRRPLCVFCAGTLGLELVCAFLPQTGRFVPFAAFFIAGLLWALAGRLRKSPAWGYGICLILGAVLGLVLTGSTQAKWDAIQNAYDGRSVLLEAEGGRLPIHRFHPQDRPHPAGEIGRGGGLPPGGVRQPARLQPWRPGQGPLCAGNTR